MAQKVDIAVQISTTPVLSLWTRPYDGTAIILSYDNSDHSHDFTGGGLILEARPPSLVEGSERRGVRLKLALTGDVDSALSDDIGSPVAWIWWLSGGTQGAPRVDSYYTGIIDSLVRTPTHEAILTVTNPLAYLTPPALRTWTHANQLGRYSGDNGWLYTAGIAALGLKPIRSGEPD